MPRYGENLSMNFIWNNQKPKDSLVPLHNHHYHELVYYVHGSGVTNIGGKRYEFHKNTFVIIPPGMEHDEWRDTEVEVICMGFVCGYDLPAIFFSDDNHYILQMLRDILRECTTQLPGYTMLITARLHELYVQVARDRGARSLQEKDFSYIINYLAENCHERIRLADCAAQLDISYDYFQHRFKELTGHSPQKYLINQRLLAAERMLLQEDISCTEIAYRCGFSTSAQFSMLFKKKHGVPPQKYRAQHSGVWTPDTTLHPF